MSRRKVVRQISVKIDISIYELIKKLAEYKDRPFGWVVKRGIENYYKITLGNRLNIKKE